MRKLIIMVFLSLCAFSMLGNEVYIKISNTSLYDTLNVECLINEEVFQSVEIPPECDEKIKIPLKEDNVNYQIVFKYPDKSISVSLYSVYDFFGRIGLKYNDDYSDDGNGLSGDLDQSKIYYDKINLSI